MEKLTSYKSGISQYLANSETPLRKFQRSVNEIFAYHLPEFQVANTENINAAN